MTFQPPPPPILGELWGCYRQAFPRTLAGKLIASSFFVFCCLTYFLRGADADQGKPPLPPLSPKVRQTYVGVLMWHDVVPGKKQVWFDTTTAEMQSQLEAIRRRGFHVVSLDALIRHLTEGAPLPPRPLALTFDDNTQGLYDYAYPLLKKYGYPATLFVHTAYVGVTTVKHHCTWDELRAMERSGLITVQSLTRTHPPDLRKLTDGRIMAELRASKQALERQLGHPIVALAYPEGHYDDRIARMAAAAGYRLGFMEDWGNADASKNLLEIHRYSIHVHFAQALDDVARAYRDQGMRKR